MQLLREAVGRLRLRAPALPERGIQFQVAALSLSGVIVVGAICLFGLRLEANTQTTADTSAALATIASALSEHFLRRVSSPPNSCKSARKTSSRGTAR
jgi:hypothetical protein